MKRVTTVNRWCVLFAAGATLALGACVEDGPKAPPLLGVPGPTAPVLDGGAGSSSIDAGGGGQGGSGQGGSAGTAGAGGIIPLTDAGADADAADAG